MSDEPTPPLLEESSQPPKWPFLYSRRCMVSLCVLLLASLVTAGIFLQPTSWFTPSPDDMAPLKSQVEDLSSRVAQLEAARKSSLMPLVDPKQLTDMDARLTTLSEQVEALRNQPKEAASYQLSEQSLAFEKILEKKVENLGKTQKTLKSLLLFSRLKAKVLSEAPYAEELADFKISANHLNGLKILEKYASQGLQAITKRPEDLVPPSSAEASSWWDRLKAIAPSLIKIEKVDAPFPSPLSQDRQVVGETLAQIEEFLAQQLASMPGDAS